MSLPSSVAMTREWVRHFWVPRVKRRDRSQWYNQHSRWNRRTNRMWHTWLWKVTHGRTCAGSLNLTTTIQMSKHEGSKESGSCIMVSIQYRWTRLYVPGLQRKTLVPSGHCLMWWHIHTVLRLSQCSAKAEDVLSWLHTADLRTLKIYHFISLQFRIDKPWWTVLNEAHSHNHNYTLRYRLMSLRNVI